MHCRFWIRQSLDNGETETEIRAGRGRDKEAQGRKTYVVCKSNTTSGFLVLDGSDLT